MSVIEKREVALADLNDLISQIALPTTGSFPASLPEGQRSAEQASGSVRIETNNTGHVVNFCGAMGRKRGDVDPPQDINLLPPGGTLHVPAGSRVRVSVPKNSDDPDYWREFSFPQEGGYLRGPIAWGWAYGDDFQDEMCLEDTKVLRDILTHIVAWPVGVSAWVGAGAFYLYGTDWTESGKFIATLMSSIPSFIVAMLAGIAMESVLIHWARNGQSSLRKTRTQAIRLPDSMRQECRALVDVQRENKTTGEQATGIDREIGSALISFSHAYQELNRRTQSDPDRYRGLEMGKLHHAARTISSLARSFADGRGRDDIEIRASLVRLITEATRQVWAASEGHRKDDTQDMMLSIRALAAQLGCDLEEEKEAA